MNGRKAKGLRQLAKICADNRGQPNVAYVGVERIVHVKVPAGPHGPAQRIPVKKVQVVVRKDTFRDSYLLLKSVEKAA